MHAEAHARRQTKTTAARAHILNSTLPAAGLSFALSPLQNHNSITVKRECNVLNTNLQSPIHFCWVNPGDNNVSRWEGVDRGGDQYLHGWRGILIWMYSYCFMRSYIYLKSTKPLGSSLPPVLHLMKAWALIDHSWQGTSNYLPSWSINGMSRWAAAIV